MKERYKTYLKLNLISIFFIAVSFISISLAWFAYSGLVRTQTEIDVKAWHIEFNKSGEAVSNNVVISLSDIQPGMNSTYEKINIKNYGDSDAKISYKIEEVRILNEDLSIPFEFGSIEDKLANDYPFSINVSLNKKYLDAKTGEAVLNIGVAWPLDSDTDEEDSYWGNLAYEYQQTNPNAPSIKISIVIKAEQNTDNYKYNSGDVFLYDAVNNVKCDKLGNTCIKTHILNTNVSEGDELFLLPDLYDTYQSGTFNDYNTLLTNTWTVDNRDLKLNDILNLVSQDIDNTYLIRNNLSDRIIGYIEYNNRFNNYLNNIIKPYNSYIKYDTTKYSFLSSNNCYWINTEYNETQAFALVKDQNKGNIITPYDKTNICGVVPVIVLPKSILINEN
ncbi:MAG: hypothetical protein PUA90_00305 [bacterium]|nr:hypothetical protein [bacterium]